MKMMIMKNDRKSGGFTLAEVLIAGLVMTIGIVSIINQMPKLVEWDILSRNKVRAVVMAQSKIDHIQSLRYDEIVPTASGDFSDLVNLTEYPEIANITWSYSSTEIAKDLMKQVDLDIIVSAKGDTSALEFTFFVTDWADVI